MQQKGIRPATEAAAATHLSRRERAEAWPAAGGRPGPARPHVLLGVARGGIRRRWTLLLGVSATPRRLSSLWHQGNRRVAPSLGVVSRSYEEGGGRGRRFSRRAFFRFGMFRGRDLVSLSVGAFSGLWATQTRKRPRIGS